MATTPVTNITWDDNDGTSVSAAVGTAIDATKTAIITPTGPLEEMVILIRNTEGSTNVVTVKAGDNPPGFSAGLGDLALTTIAATTGMIVLPPLESARFLQNDGTVQLTFETSMTGYIIALQKPGVKSGT